MSSLTGGSARGSGCGSASGFAPLWPMQYIVSPVVTYRRPCETIGDALVWGGTKRYVNLKGKGDVSILLPRSSSRKIKASIIYEGPLKPPIKEGDQVAILRVTTTNDAVNEIPLYAAEDIGEGPIWMKGFESLLHLAFGWIL